MRTETLLIGVLIGVMGSLSGCHYRLIPAASGVLSSPLQQEAAPASRTPLTPAQLKQIRPDETGLIPIVEYHDIGTKERYMVRSVANFRKDLDRLYQESYLPISVEEYLSNRIALPAGKSPVILTFDDARDSQFRYLKDGSLDPDCAIAILKDFHANHPDFALKAIFFVLPHNPFGQVNLAARKMQELLAMGFEIGNHTVTHRHLNRLSDTEVQEEIATCVQMVQKLAPQARVDTLAFPGGHSPRNRALIAKGEYKGQKYVNRAGFLAAYSPVPPPTSPHYTPMGLQRILAIDSKGGISYWLDRLKNGPEHRYISDGDPNTLTAPRSEAKEVDPSKLNGLTLRLY
jgi:peptidoglycan/xylan/chitin deacetylase (PgdA/CDA1 family)